MSIDDRLRDLAHAAADEVAAGLDLEDELRAVHRAARTAPDTRPGAASGDPAPAVVRSLRRRPVVQWAGAAAAGLLLVVGGLVVVASLDGGDDDSADAPLEQSVPEADEGDDAEAPAEIDAPAGADEEMSDDDAAGADDEADVEAEAALEEADAESSGPASVSEVGRRSYRQLLRPAIRELRAAPDFAGRSFDAAEGGILVVRIIGADPARIAEVEEFLAGFVTDAVVIPVDR